MKCNMGSADRIVRGMIGVTILAVGGYFRSWWGLIGLIPVATALLGRCPAYVPFNISTLKKKEPEG